MSITSILIATDLTPRSRVALSLALNIAKKNRSDLHVLHIREHVLNSAFEELEPRINQHIETEFNSIRSKAKEYDLVLRCETSSGDVVDEIVGKAREADADLVIIGAHQPEQGILNDVFGNTPRGLLQESKTPLIISRTPSENTYKRILAFVDFSEESKAALSLALQCAADNSDLFALHCCSITPLVRYLSAEDGLSPKMQQAVQDQEMTAREKLITWLKEIEGINRVNIIPRVETGNPARIGLGIASEFNVQLIAAGSRGMSPLRKFVIGSTAEALLHKAHCDTLIAPSTDSR